MDQDLKDNMMGALEQVVDPFHMKKGLDVQQPSEKCRCFGDAAALGEIFQVFDGEQMLHMLHMVACRFHDFILGTASVEHLCGFDHR